MPTSYGSYTRDMSLVNMAKIVNYLLHNQAKFSQYVGKTMFSRFHCLFHTEKGGCLIFGVNIKILPNLDSMAFFTQKMKGCLTIGVSIKVLHNLDSMAFLTQKWGGGLLDNWSEL